MESASEWNEFAHDYALIQQESQLPIEVAVTDQIAAWYPDHHWRLADVAAGSGRYALPLSRYYQHVHMIDWAAAMLAEASRWLTAHGQHNFDTAVCDWRQLPPVPLTELVFISQLPSLRASDWPKVSKLASRAVILNQQIEQRNELLVAIAGALALPLPAAPQVAPNRVAALKRKLAAAGRAYHEQQFSYALTTPSSIADLLPEFAVPINVTTAHQLADALTPGHDPHELRPTVTHYTFSLLTWTK